MLYSCTTHFPYSFFFFLIKERDSTYNIRFWWYLFIIKLRYQSVFSVKGGLNPKFLFNHNKHYQLIKDICFVDLCYLITIYYIIVYIRLLFFFFFLTLTLRCSLFFLFSFFLIWLFNLNFKMWVIYNLSEQIFITKV